MITFVESPTPLRRRAQPGNYRNGKHGDFSLRHLRDGCVQKDKGRFSQEASVVLFIIFLSLGTQESVPLDTR